MARRAPGGDPQTLVTLTLTERQVSSLMNAAHFRLEALNGRVLNSSISGADRLRALNDLRSLRNAVRELTEGTRRALAGGELPTDAPG